MSRFSDHLARKLESVLGASVHSAEPLGGGCIANATRLETSRGDFFLKYAGGEAGRTFEAEAEGLRALGASNSDVVIPEVQAVAAPSGDTPGYLVLDYIEPGAPDQSFWPRFGRSLATLHKMEGEAYGFHIDNFIGRLPQFNDPVEPWPEFFAARRLDPQRRVAEQGGRWRSNWNKPYDRLVARLPEILPSDPPKSVLHGDLWSGNFLVTSDGRAALVDPATYYGHRETDLAMAELFGGFERAFYDAYRESWPLEEGYRERREIYQLYHLINHLNHFGSSYSGSVERILVHY